jgi:hypothetical protein
VLPSHLESAASSSTHRAASSSPAPRTGGLYQTLTAAAYCAPPMPYIALLPAAVRAQNRRRCCLNHHHLRADSAAVLIEARAARLVLGRGQVLRVLVALSQDQHRFLGCWNAKLKGEGGLDRRLVMVRSRTWKEVLDLRLGAAFRWIRGLMDCQSRSRGCVLRGLAGGRGLWKASWGMYGSRERRGGF